MMRFDDTERSFKNAINYISSRVGTDFQYIDL